jgi:hypothetical protein
VRRYPYIQTIKLQSVVFANTKTKLQRLPWLTHSQTPTCSTDDALDVKGVEWTGRRLVEFAMALARASG